MINALNLMLYQVGSIVANLQVYQIFKIDFLGFSLQNLYNNNQFTKSSSQLDFNDFKVLFLNSKLF